MNSYQISQLMILALLVIGGSFSMYVNIINPSLATRIASAVLIYFLGAITLWQILRVTKLLTDEREH
ncbi:hypothetical protein CVS42_11375 [Aeromonas veronii]|nr:hypothetical protein CVS42_11375 [Aeromonas veronii]